MLNHCWPWQKGVGLQVIYLSGNVRFGVFHSLPQSIFNLKWLVSHVLAIFLMTQEVWYAVFCSFSRNCCCETVVVIPSMDLFSSCFDHQLVGFNFVHVLVSSAAPTSTPPPHLSILHLPPSTPLLHLVLFLLFHHTHTPLHSAPPPTRQPTRPLSQILLDFHEGQTPIEQGSRYEPTRVQSWIPTHR